VAAFAAQPWADIALERNPGLQAQFLASRRLEWMGKYGGFWAMMKLSAAQVERFQAIMTEAAERELDIKATARASSLPDADPVVAKLREASAQRAREAERELLGEDGLRRLADYDRLLPARSYVDGLMASLVFMGAPLAEPQAERLTQILAAASRNRGSFGEANWVGQDLSEAMRKGEPAREPIDTAAVLAQARTVLSPVQYARLEAELLRARLLYQTYNLMRDGSTEPVIGFVWGRP
jgi:hypothetical protein